MSCIRQAGTLSTLPHSFSHPSLVLRPSASPSHSISVWVSHVQLALQCLHQKGQELQPIHPLAQLRQQLQTAGFTQPIRSFLG